MSKKVIVITGCSTGLGRALALSALDGGHKVVATARNVSTLDDLKQRGAKVFELDVTSNRAFLNEFAGAVVQAFGQVDVLVNNAGYFQGGAVEELSIDEIQSQFNTNFFSVINVTNAFLPHLRSRRSGLIANISSQGSFIAVSGGGIYCASKAALDGISAVWYNELRPLGIQTVTIGLGAFRTAVAGSNTKGPLPQNEISDYQPAHDYLVDFRARSGQELGDTDKVASRLVDIISWDWEKLRQLPLYLPLGEDAVTLHQKYLKQRLEDAEKVAEYGMGLNADGLKYEGAGW